MCLELRLNGILLFTGAVVVSCFIQSGALESPDVLLSYPITSLSSPMTCQCTDIYPLLSNIHVHLFIYLSIYLIILHNAMQVSHGKSLCRSLRSGPDSGPYLSMSKSKSNLKGLYLCTGRYMWH